MFNLDAAAAKDGEMQHGRRHIGERLWATAAVAVGLTGGSVGSARADCALFPFATVRPLVESFVFRPAGLLREFPLGGDDMLYRVMLVAASSKTAIAPLVQIAKSATPAQRNAIAAGLGVAARRCERRTPQHTRRIEIAVRTYANVDFAGAFGRNFRTQTTLAVEERERIRTEQIRQGLTPAPEAPRPMLPNVAADPSRPVPALPSPAAPIR